VIADVLHLAAAGIWMGTLLVILVVSLPHVTAAGARDVIAAYSPWALTGAATLAATGVLASWLHLQELPNLWQSRYGLVLCLKLALVAAVVALGAYNWKRTTPQLASSSGLVKLGAAVRAELAIAAAVFAVTAVLVATALPGE
jgi:putative copper export protein